MLSYLLGCFPSAYIAGRLTRGVDIREIGDGNMGTANAFRELGARTGICVFLADVTKGAAAVLLAQWAGLSQVFILLAGVAAVAGHNWPVFLKFRGGRGEATAIGVLLVLVPQETFPLLAPMGACLLATRNVTRSATVLFVPLPLVSWLFGAPAAVIAYSVALPSLVGITHYITRQAQAFKPLTSSEVFPGSSIHPQAILLGEKPLALPS